ncbi:Transcription elongation factor [Trichinella spiralis]
MIEHITISFPCNRSIIFSDSKCGKPSESLRPASYSHISWQMLVLSVRETKSTASSGPVSRRISARSFRMKKLCDAVSKRMKTTCYYPACIPLICSLHTLSNQLFELRSHWRSGLHCRTVTM